MAKYIGQQVVLPESRILFPAVFKPSKYGRYEVSAVVDPEKKDEWSKIDEVLVEVASKAFGLNKTEAKKQLKSGDLRSPLKSLPDGDLVFQAAQAEEKGAPTVVDLYQNQITETRSSEIRNGIMGNVVVFIMAYTVSEKNRGITARINVLQKTADASGGGKQAALGLLPKAEPQKVTVPADDDDSVDAALDRMFAA